MRREETSALRYYWPHVAVAIGVVLLTMVAVSSAGCATTPKAAPAVTVSAPVPPAPAEAATPAALDPQEWYCHQGAWRQGWEITSGMWPKCACLCTRHAKPPRGPHLCH